MSTQPATSPKPATIERHSDILNRMATAGDRPGRDSEGLDHLIDAAHAAAVAYDELDYQAHVTPAGPVYEILALARESAYETWQRLERLGLPMLHAWQRECLGYRERDLAH